MRRRCRGKMGEVISFGTGRPQAARSRDRLRRLARLTPSCGGLAPIAKRSEWPKGATGAADPLHALRNERQQDVNRTQTDGDQPRSNAERQARSRTEHGLVCETRSITTQPIDRRSRPTRWRDAAAVLLTLEAEYADWLEAP